MAESSPYGLYLDILKTFERLDIPYVIIGAFAGMSYGVTRLTADAVRVIAQSTNAKPSPAGHATRAALT